MDLVGKKFGTLTVIRRDPDDYITPATRQRVPRWLCRCDCGAEKIILQNALTATNRPTRNCGCLRRQKTIDRGEDLTGCRFGRLTVIKKVALEKPRPNGVIHAWLCRCDCGAEVTHTAKDLKEGRTRSCGCLLSETATKKLTEKNVLQRHEGTQITAIKPDRKANKNSKTGIKGVGKRGGVYRARIMVKGKEVYLGRFADIEGAIKARAEAEKEFFEPLREKYLEGKKS